MNQYCMNNNPDIRSSRLLVNRREPKMPFLIVGLALTLNTVHVLSILCAV